MADTYKFPKRLVDEINAPKTIKWADNIVKYSKGSTLLDNGLTISTITIKITHKTIKTSSIKSVTATSVLKTANRRNTPATIAHTDRTMINTLLKLPPLGKIVLTIL
jgi:hypothetical protein